MSCRTFVTSEQQTGAFIHQELHSSVSRKSSALTFFCQIKWSPCPAVLIKQRTVFGMFSLSTKPFYSCVCLLMCLSVSLSLDVMCVFVRAWFQTSTRSCSSSTAVRTRSTRVWCWSFGVSWGTPTTSWTRSGAPWGPWKELMDTVRSMA